jgi:hypothetical protein
MTGGIERQRMLEARIIPGLLQSIEHDSKQTRRRLASELGPERVIVTPLLGVSEQVEHSQLMEQAEVLASTEQLDNGTVREKAAKSGRARPIASPPLSLSSCGAGASSS